MSIFPKIKEIEQNGEVFNLNYVETSKLNDTALYRRGQEEFFAQSPQYTREKEEHWRKRRESIKFFFDNHSTPPGSQDFGGFAFNSSGGVILPLNLKEVVGSLPGRFCGVETIFNTSGNFKEMKYSPGMKIYDFRNTHTFYETSYECILSTIVFFLMLNDFLEHGDPDKGIARGNASMNRFFSDKKNMRRVQESYNAGVIPHYQLTEKLYYVTKGEGMSFSFLRCTKRDFKALSSVANLTWAELIFWLDNTKHEPRTPRAPWASAQGEDEELRAWSEIVKRRSKTMLSRYAKLDGFIERLYRKVDSRVRPTLVREGFEQPTRVFLTDFNKKSSQLFLKSFYAHCLLNIPKFKLSDVKLETVYLVVEASAHPGRFIGGGDRKQLANILRDTLEACDYNLDKFTDFIRFLASGTNIPRVRRNEWKEFINSVLSMGISTKDNLQPYAQVFLTSPNPNRTSNTFIDMVLFERLKQVDLKNVYNRSSAK